MSAWTSAIMNKQFMPLGGTLQNVGDLSAQLHVACA